MTENRQGGGDRGSRSESKQAAKEVREGLGDVAREGKERARSFLDEQKEVAAERAHGFAVALRDTAHQLENRGEGSSASHYAERAAQGIDRMADSLRDKDINSMLRDTQRFARSSPALFVGGSIVVGLLLGRFLRSSGSHDPRPQSRSFSGSLGDGGQGDLSRDPSRFGGEVGSQKPQQQPGSTGSTQRYPGAPPPTGGQR